MADAVRKRRTLAERTSMLRGPGLHTGVSSAVFLAPAPAGSGLSFRRSDLPGAPVIPARAAALVPAVRCTALRAGKALVQTVEHVLAACALSGLDDAVIELDGEEVPAADGSALPFLELIEVARLADEEGYVAPASVPRQIIVAGRNGRGSVVGSPAPAPSFVFTFAGGGMMDGKRVAFVPGADDPHAIAGARTFCFEAELEMLRMSGLGRGGTAENCLVLRADGTPLNPARFPDEPVRHKLLDLIGDLALAGGPLAAAVEARGSGHALHQEFLAALGEAVRA